jgi:hypothetical protein
VTNSLKFVTNVVTIDLIPAFKIIKIAANNIRGFFIGFRLGLK